MYNGKLVKLLVVSEEDKWDFDPGYSENMEMAEGKFGFIHYHDEDDDTYKIQSSYGEFWYSDVMFEIVKPITSNKYFVGDKMIPNEINTTKRDLSYTNEYAGVEGTIVNVYEGDIIELEFEDGEKNFYFSHWLKPQTEYNAF